MEATFIKTLKVSINGRKIVEARYKPAAGMTKNQIDEFANNFKDGLIAQGKNGSIGVATLEPFGWRSSKIVPMTQNVRSYRIDDYYDLADDIVDERVNEFSIYFYSGYQAAGGIETHNDCLFNCIYEFSGRKLKYFPTPEELKKFLKLDRDDLIPIKLMPRVETAYRININVTGDHCYTSEGKRKDTLNLELSKCHYSLKKDEKADNLKVSVKNFKNHIPVVFKKDGSNYILYDGKEKLSMNYDNFSNIRKEFHDRYKFIKCKSKASEIEKFYHQLKVDIADIFEKTKGEIDLNQFLDIKSASFDLFCKMSHQSKLPADIGQDEALWLDSAYRCGLIDAQPGFYTDCYSYDKNSQYPYALKSLTFPMSPGRFCIIDKIPEGTIGNVKYGIYRCKIGITNYKLFVGNKDNKYTHYDIMSARLQGFTVDLIQDGMPNALIYDDLVTGRSIFGKYVDYLFKLKSDGCKMAKKLLNILPGAFCEKNKHKTVVRNDLNLEKVKLLSIQPFEETYIVEHMPLNKIFKTNYARVGPFINAFSRYKMSELLFPHRNLIVRIHTDGFISLKPIQLPIGPEIGKFKLEHENQNVKVLNVNTVTWIESEKA